MEMKIVQEDFRVSTRSRSQMIDITSQVSSIVGESGITDGDAIVYCPHTTAAITINENADPSVPHDILLTLDQLLPQHRSGYRHSEGNSDAHCKSSLLGCSEQILIEGGSLQLGTWQGIFFCEFDGPRSRKVIVQVRGQ
ncbi:MAG TPA: secondary thiamine-phosphate synthase enzyme YjbQ [Sedimentisphaerales bacterium]|nr:secondary thiamine-phosphate synthase enzyme YjbQ [Sedimentisphaerales bacterium]